MVKGGVTFIADFAFSTFNGLTGRALTLVAGFAGLGLVCACAHCMKENAAKTKICFFMFLF
jgi:hypothetical protein